MFIHETCSVPQQPRRREAENGMQRSNETDVNWGVWAHVCLYDLLDECDCQLLFIAIPSWYAVNISDVEVLRTSMF